MSAGWYYMNGDQQVGPVESTTILSRVAAREVRDDAYVWREGMADWKPLRETELAPQTPPPIPRTGPPSRVAVSDAASNSGIAPTAEEIAEARKRAGIAAALAVLAIVFYVAGNEGALGSANGILYLGTLAAMWTAHFILPKAWWPGTLLLGSLYLLSRSSKYFGKHTEKTLIEDRAPRAENALPTWVPIAVIGAIVAFLGYAFLK